MNTKKIFLSLILFLTVNIVYGQNCSLNAGVDQTLCANAALTLTGAETGIFQSPHVTTWSQVLGPSASITSPNSLITTVTGLIGGNTYKFRLSSSCGDGSLTYDDVTVTVNSISTANANTTGIAFSAICPGNNVATLAGSALGSGETGLWSVVSGGGGLTINTPSSPTSTLKLTAGSGNSGNAVLRWTVTSSAGCSTFSDVTIPKMSPVTPITAGPNQTLNGCYATTATATMAGSYAGDGTGGQQGSWSTISGPNRPTITTTTSASTTITNLITGTYIFRWTVSGPCVSGSSDVQVTVASLVGAVTAATASISGSPSMPFCDGRTEVTLVGATPKGTETVLWSQTVGPTATIVNSTSPTTLITGLDGSSNYTFNYTVTNPATTCTSSKTVSISFGTAPSVTITTTKPLLLNCAVTSASIAYTQSGTGTVQYSIISGPTTPTILTIPSAYANAASPLVINGLTVPGTYLVRLKKSPGSGSLCTTAYDEIEVVVSQSPTASNAGSGQNLACTVKNTSLIGNTPTVGTGSWSQVSGPNTAGISNSALANCPISGLVAGTYTFRWLITGGVKCTPNQADVIVKVATAQPTTSNAGSPQTICYSSPLILSGNTPALNETGKWTVSPSSGVTFSNVNSPTAVVTGLSANTVYTFTWTISNSCGSSASNVAITTNGVVGPIAALAGSDQCLASATTTATLAANNPSPGTGLWSKLSGPSCTITSPTIYNSGITGMSNGTYYFEWAITRNACTITRDTMMITISAAATTANAGIDQTICGTTATMAANTPSVGTGTWSQVSGKGGAVFSSPTNPTASVTGLSSGTYTFRWTISNGACSSNSDDVILYVSTPPTTANAGTDVSVCAGGTQATITAVGPITSGSGYWSLVSGPNVPTITSATSLSTTVTGLTTGTYTLRWTVDGGPFCPQSTDDMNIYVVPTANAGSAQTLCGINTAYLGGNASSTGTWTMDSKPVGAADPTITVTSSSTAVVTNLNTQGAYVFRYTITPPAQSSCSSTYATVTITYYPTPTAANAGANQEFCTSASNKITSWTMAANTPSVGTGAWSKVSGNYTPTITTVSSPTTTVGTGSKKAYAGTYVYRWTITNGTCTSTSDVTIQIDSVGTANAGANQSHVCGSTATLAAVAPPFGGGTWTQVGGPNTAVFTSEVSNNTTVTGLVSGTYTFRWTITDGTCSSSYADVNITVYDNPSIPIAGVDQNIFGGTTATLAGNIISSGTGLWTKVSGPNCTITDTSNPSSTVTGMTAGTYVFQWTSTLGTCTLSDQVQIVLYDNPTQANAGNDISACLYAALTLSANTPSVGTGTWTQIAGNTVVLSNANSPTSSILGALSGSYTFRWTIMNGVSGNNSIDDVNVTVYDPPTMAITGMDKAVKRGKTTTISGNTPTIGAGVWTKISAPSNAALDEGLISLPNSPSTSITNLHTSGAFVYRWTITNGPCSSFDDITVTKNSYVVSNKKTATPKL